MNNRLSNAIITIAILIVLLAGVLYGLTCFVMWDYTLSEIDTLARLFIAFLQCVGSGLIIYNVLSHYNLID